MPSPLVANRPGALADNVRLAPEDLPAARPTHDNADSVVLRECRLSGDGRLAVVGESYYQPALRRAARGQVAGSTFEQMIPADVRLVPEPSNPYDLNAVRVEARTEFGFELVGHIARDDAPDYQKVLLDLQNRGRVGICAGRITGGALSSMAYTCTSVLLILSSSKIGLPVELF